MKRLLWVVLTGLALNIHAGSVETLPQAIQLHEPTTTQVEVFWVKLHYGSNVADFRYNIIDSTGQIRDARNLRISDFPVARCTGVDTPNECCTGVGTGANCDYWTQLVSEGVGTNLRQKGNSFMWQHIQRDYDLVP